MSKNFIRLISKDFGGIEKFFYFDRKRVRKDVKVGDLVSIKHGWLVPVKGEDDPFKAIDKLNSPVGIYTGDKVYKL